MAYKISDECIMCGACEGECPVGAISEGEGKYVIDPEKCISCGRRAARAACAAFLRCALPGRHPGARACAAPARGHHKRVIGLDEIS